MSNLSYRAATGSRRGQYVATATHTHGDGSQATTRDVVDFIAWLPVGGMTFKAGNLSPAIAQRAVAWLKAHNVTTPGVGKSVGTDYIQRALDAVVSAGVPADDPHIAAMRAHYGLQAGKPAGKPAGK